MGLIHNRNTVNAVMVISNGYLTSMQTKIGEASKSFQALINEDMSGTTAQTIKECLEFLNTVSMDVSGKVLQSLIMAVIRYSNASEKLDGDNAAIIPQENLENLKEDFSAGVGGDLRSMTDIIDGYVADAFRLCDTIPGPYDRPVPSKPVRADASAALQAIELVRSSAENALVRLAETETGFANDENLTTAMNTMGSLEGVVNRGLSNMQAGYFSVEAIANSPEMADLEKTYNEMYEAMNGKWQSYIDSIPVVQTIYDEMTAEYEKRKRNAEMAKTGAAIGKWLIVTGAVILAAPTGGLSMGACVLLYATTSGAESLIDSYFDQQVGTLAGAGKIDGFKLFTDTMFGAAEGAAFGYIDYLTMNSMSGLGLKEKVITKGISSVMKESVKIGGETLENGLEAIQGKREWSEVSPDFSDFVVREFFAFGSGALGELVGGTVGEKIGKALHIENMSVDNTLRENLVIGGKNIIADLPKSATKSFVSALGDEAEAIVSDDGIDFEKGDAARFFTNWGTGFLGEVAEGTTEQVVNVFSFRPSVYKSKSVEKAQQELEDAKIDEKKAYNEYTEAQYLKLEDLPKSEKEYTDRLVAINKEAWTDAKKDVDVKTKALDKAIEYETSIKINSKYVAKASGASGIPEHAVKIGDKVEIGPFPAKKDLDLKGPAEAVPGLNIGPEGVQPLSDVEK